MTLSSKLSYIYLCKGCESFQLQPLSQAKKENNQHVVPSDVLFDKSCKLCGGSLQIGGPIWTNPLFDPPFLQQMQSELDSSQQFGTFRRMQGMLQLVSEELPDCPLYYQLDRLCCLANCRMPPVKMIRSAIINGGFRVSYSHAYKNTIKTDAPNEFIWCIIKKLAEMHQAKVNQNSPAYKIISKEFDFQIEFDLIEDEAPLSKSQNLLRYQINPEENWGPKARPLNKRDKREQNQGKRSSKNGTARNWKMIKTVAE